MVSISDKAPTKRTATAVCCVRFSNNDAVRLVHENRAKKGDVLGVARIAGIMAAKQTPALIPLCHPISITHVSVDVEVAQDGDSASTTDGLAKEPVPSSTNSASTQPSPPLPTHAQLSNAARVDISATVSCDGKTGVEMEALTAASVAALTVYDMCKAVDKGMRIEGLRVTRKEGGKSGMWVEGEQAG